MALELKEKGNELYKKKEFEEALKYYELAIEAEPNDLIYCNNKAAVLVEMERYQECIDFLSKQLEKRYEMNEKVTDGASYAKCAKAYSRISTCYHKLKDYDNAIEMLQKSLTEVRARSVQSQLYELRRERDRYLKEKYHDPELSEKHRLQGNEFFKASKIVEAKAEYDEAIARNDKDARLYSNRAACFTKLLSYPQALSDLDTCLELDPTFIKAYIRKGMVYYSMKDWKKALEAYESGLELDPNNEECIRGRFQTHQEIRKMSSSKDIDEEQVRKAAQDPEIQRILTDPQMGIILKRIQEDPKCLSEYLKDPKVVEAIAKLQCAGILRTG